MTPAERNRLIGILGMLSSTFDGERASAALLATRLLNTLGTSWDKLIPQAIASAGERPEASDWHVDLDLCKRRLAMVTPWEREFLTSVSYLKSLTEKQSAVLTRIAAKLRARGWQ